jgi:hypothetical protein
MINQKHCPFCQSSSAKGCAHLALAAEARDFVRRCVERSQGQTPWQLLVEQRHHLRGTTSEWSPDHEDFTWLETAFCDMFLKNLSWFGAMDYEWRSGPRPEEGGFWVLLWSRNPQQLWWELRDDFERKALKLPPPSDSSAWLLGLSPR